MASAAALQRLGLAAAGALLCAAAAAQDATRGAELYVRLPNDTRSCVSCHGPDPGLSHNNILRAADNPNGLTQVLNTVSAMGFLRSSLSDTDRADIAAFLGAVSRARAADSRALLWPITFEFGSVPLQGASAVQTVQVTNPSASQPFAVGAPAVSYPAFEIFHDCPATLAPGAQCTLRLRLKPSASGLVRGAVRVGDAGSAGARYVGLFGYGATAPASALEWRPAGDALRFDAPAADGLQRRTLVLANPGPMPALLGSTSIVGPSAPLYRVESGCASGTLLVAGTQCEITLAYSASRLPLAQAALQLRSDQGNPPSLRLDGTALPETPTEPPPVPPVVPEGGGGCSVGPPRNGALDPLLVLMAWLASAALWQRRRKP